MTKDIYKTEKGHEIEISINAAHDREPVRTTTNIEILIDRLEYLKESVKKARPGSSRERLAKGAMAAIECRLGEIS